MRALAVLPGLPAVLAALITGVVIAGGLNFGYEFHPAFLWGAAFTGVVTVALGFFALTLARVHVLVRLAAPVAAIAFSFGLVVALMEVGERTPQEVIREQAPLYDEIPTHPDARRGAVVAALEYPNSDMFEDGFLNQPTCCWTSRTDELRTPLLVAEVAEFYLAAVEADGWRVRRRGAGGPNQRADLIGHRGDAAIDVAVRPRTGRPPVVDIIIDGS